MSTNSKTNKHSLLYALAPKRPVSLDGLLKAFAILFVALVTAPFWGSFLMSIPANISGAPDYSVDRLVQQARGDKYYWDAKGEAWSSWNALHTRHPKRRARKDAINKLGNYKPLPENARNALIALLVDGESDYDSGDGVYAFRSTICYTLGRAADHWSAYEAMFKVLRDRALNPEFDRNNSVKWFDKSWRHYGSDLTGPSAIVRGLKYTPPEQHEAIIARLEELLAELQSAPVSSEWAISEIEDGIKALKDDSKMRFIQIELEDWENSPYGHSYW